MKAEKTYDEYWSSDLHRTGEWSEAYFNEHLGALKGCNRVLDYGCGMGYAYQRRLAASVGVYWAADVSDVALADAKSKKFETLKIREDSSIAVPDKFFDGVVCSEVLEHLYDPLAAAKELHRVLKPGGVAVMTVPHFGYFPWRLRALLLAEVWSEPESATNPFKGVHIRHFSSRALVGVGRFAGFESCRVFPFDHCNIWHLAHVTGPLSPLFRWAENNLPSWTRLSFLDRVLLDLFAQRLRMVCFKSVVEDPVSV